jgi:hypothetical protein
MAIGNTYRTAQRGIAGTALGDTKRSSLTSEDQLLSSLRKVALAALQAYSRSVEDTFRGTLPPSSRVPSTILPRDVDDRSLSETSETADTKATGVKNRPFAECAREHQNCLVRKVALIPNATPKTFYKSFI